MESNNNQDNHSIGEHIIKRKWKLLVGIVVLIVIVAAGIWGCIYYNNTYIPQKLLKEAVEDITNKFETSTADEKLTYAYAIQSGADFEYSGVHSNKIRENLWQLHKPALEYIEKQAYEGNAIGQYLLGKLYADSPYMQRSNGKAAYWWNEAAKQGYAPAYFDLGMAYKNGEGVEKDLREAIKWLKLGAEAGIDDAQNIYGDIFLTGVCERANDYFPIRERIGGSWSCNGWSEASYKVIIPIDIDQAKYWWKKAAEQGNLEAKDKLQKIY